MEDSIFTKIIRGEIPSHKIYEDDKTIAFLDIYPAQYGQVLVVPKVQVEDFFDLQPGDYRHFFESVQKVALKLHEVFPDKKRIALQIEGLDVPHVHAKLFPIDSGEEFRAIPDTSNDPDHAALSELAKKLAIS